MYCFNQLGVLFARGYGVKKDPYAALDYYKRAAELGDSLAYCNVGWLYESGQLGSPDLEGAIKWYRYGAFGGDENCKDQLIRLGIPIPSNKVIMNDNADTF